MLFLYIYFPLLSIWDPEEFSGKCLPLPSTGDRIRGLERAGQLCHQLNYIPSPGKWVFKSNWNLEASQTFVNISFL